MKFQFAFKNQKTNHKTSGRKPARVLLAFCLTALFAGATFAQDSAPTQTEKPGAPSSTSVDRATGILLMAHGGGKDWNAKVNDVAAEVDKQIPTEVALGMADRATLQAGIDKLAARGVTQIVAVPLFVSSHSSVIESTKYLLALRSDAPKDLADFAMMGDMSSTSGAPKMQNASAKDRQPKSAESPDPAAKHELPKPIKSPVALRMASALDDHPLVAQILADRAAAIAKDPAREVVIVVAHGPNDDQDNTQWLSDMSELVKQISAQAHYVRVEYATLRDDADAAVRDQATAELRKAAESANAAGHHVLIVPLLLSYGGIENGLRQRLDGVEHTMSPQGLLPDPRIAEWVLESARAGHILNSDPQP